MPKSRKHIQLVIATQRYAEPACGTTLITYLLASHISRGGNKVTILCAPLDKLDKEPLSIPSVAVIRSKFGVIQLGLKNILSSRFLLIHPTMANLLAVLCLFRPAVISFHVWFNARKIKRLIVRLLMLGSPLVACSYAVKKQLKLRALVIKNGFQMASCSSSDPRVIDVLFVGRISLDKGADLAITVAQALKGYSSSMQTVLAGPITDIALLDALKRAVSNNYLNYVGPLDHSQVASLMCSAHTLIVPSRNEPFGIIALEGLACGCHVVASDTGGLPEAVGKYGDYVSGYDPDAWARTIMSGRNACPQRMRRNEIESHLRLHDPERCAKNYMRLIRMAKPWPVGMLSR